MTTTNGAAAALPSSTCLSYRDQTHGRRPLLPPVRQKRTWNSGMEKWWGSGVTHSAHALKCPARTHLWQIMGHVVTVYIPSCHSCGLKKIQQTHRTSTAKDTSSFPRLVFKKPVLPAAALSIWQRDEDVFTHTRCSFTLEYIHPAASVWLCVHRCLCLPEEN